jgi:protocadherin Fat 4
VKPTVHHAPSPFEQPPSDGSFTDQVFSIAINDVDEFDVGTVTDTNATSNNVNENAAAVGTVVGITAPPATPMRPTTRSPIRSSITTVDDLPSTAPRASLPSPVPSTAKRTDLHVPSPFEQPQLMDPPATKFSPLPSTMSTNLMSALSPTPTQPAIMSTKMQPWDDGRGITASASDIDATNNTITYSLQNNDGGRFRHRQQYGVVTVAAAIDREADGASRSITVRATSSDGSFTDQTFSIAINDVDEFDVGAVTDTNATSNNVNENAAVSVRS